MSRKSHHVVPHPEGWAVRRGGSERASVVTGTKQESVDRGREISRNQHSEFVIHDKHGVIRQSDSHGNDPYPPRG